MDYCMASPWIDINACLHCIAAAQKIKSICQGYEESAAA
jgi:hypothetical protein